MATGYNIVDYEYAKQKGIPVSNIPAYGTDNVAEMTFALIFALIRRVELHSNDTCNNKGWSNSIDWTYLLSPQIELVGKTIGIVGWGNIGRRVGEIAAAFKMNILISSRSQNNHPSYKHKFVTLDKLYNESDIISLHCPAFPETVNMINKDTLSLFKKNAFLINTSRGQLVVEDDLANALNNGLIAGAGLDTLQQEPPEENNPLLTAKNCIITPHIAWATLEAKKRVMTVCAENIKQFLKNTPINVVNN